VPSQCSHIDAAAVPSQRSHSMSRGWGVCTTGGPLGCWYSGSFQLGLRHASLERCRGYSTGSVERHTDSAQTYTRYRATNAIAAADLHRCFACVAACTCYCTLLWSCALNLFLPVGLSSFSHGAIHAGTPHMCCYLAPSPAQCLPRSRRDRRCGHGRRRTAYTATEISWRGQCAAVSSP
jgi:hypothetical protein